jgi:5,10-methylenetetrahydromethanopterin reductase
VSVAPPSVSFPRLGLRLYGGIAPQRSAELARVAEANGFASLWFAENPMERGIMAAMAACAVATNRLELGVGSNPFPRHPVQIAMEIGALDELSGDRAIMGLGSGLAAPIKRSGIDNARPLGAMRDAFANRARAAGRQHRHLQGERAPGASALREDRRRADDLNMCPPGFSAHAASITRPKRLVQYVPFIVSEDRNKAIAAIKPVLAGMLKTFWALAQRVPAAKASPVDHSGLPQADFAAAVVDPASALDRRFVDAFSIAGTPDDCRARIAA